MSHQETKQLLPDRSAMSPLAESLFNIGVAGLPVNDHGNLAPVIPITDEPLCEGCGKPATTSDIEGVPLCDECANC